MKPEKSDIRVKPTVWRKFDVAEDKTYLIPVSGEANIGDLVKQVPIINPADHTHVDTHDPKSDGYGGSTLSFHLDDGSDYKVKGPWHGGSFSSDVFRITELHYSFVTIAREAASSGLFQVAPDSIIYQDPGWVLGPFMRGDRLARQLADVLQEKLYVVRESYGGGSAHWIEPGQRLHPMARRSEDD